MSDQDRPMQTMSGPQVHLCSVGGWTKWGGQASRLTVTPRLSGGAMSTIGIRRQARGSKLRRLRK